MLVNKISGSNLHSIPSIGINIVPLYEHDFAAENLHSERQQYDSSKSALFIFDTIV